MYSDGNQHSNDNDAQGNVVSLHTIYIYMCISKVATTIRKYRLVKMNSGKVEDNNDK